MYTLVDVNRLVTTASAMLFLGGGAFIEGTHLGWKTLSAFESGGWSEQTHEPPHLRMNELAYASTLAILVANEMPASPVLGFLQCTASLSLWAVLLARVAAATHASDGVHSVVLVPWYSVVSGVCIATVPAAFVCYAKLNSHTVLSVRAEKQ